MGYHDIAPEVFIFDPAFQETNSAEEGLLFGEWLRSSMNRAREKMKETAAATTISNTKGKSIKFIE